MINKLTGIQFGIFVVLTSLSAAIRQKTNSTKRSILSTIFKAYMLSGAETPRRLSVSSRQILAASHKARRAF